jgi:hypothetical protein
MGAQEMSRSKFLIMTQTAMKLEAPNWQTCQIDWDQWRGSQKA